MVYTSSGKEQHLDYVSHFDRVNSSFYCAVSPSELLLGANEYSRLVARRLSKKQRKKWTRPRTSHRISKREGYLYFQNEGILATTQRRIRSFFSKLESSPIANLFVVETAVIEFYLGWASRTSSVSFHTWKHFVIVVFPDQSNIKSRASRKLQLQLRIRQHYLLKV